LRRIVFYIREQRLLKNKSVPGFVITGFAGFINQSYPLGVDSEIRDRFIFSCPRFVEGKQGFLQNKSVPV
jgi:hypothetical protein